MELVLNTNMIEDSIFAELTQRDRYLSLSKVNNNILRFCGTGKYVFVLDLDMNTIKTFDIKKISNLIENIIDNSNGARAIDLINLNRIINFVYIETNFKKTVTFENGRLYI